jgi:hypothetical protein
MKDGTLVALGGVLYAASAAILQAVETEKPIPSNRSAFAVHPGLTLGEGLGAGLAVYGLYRMKPSYAVWGVAGYVLTQWLVFPKPKAGPPVALRSAAQAYLPDMVSRAGDVLGGRRFAYTPSGTLRETTPRAVTQIAPTTLPGGARTSATIVWPEGMSAPPPGYFGQAPPVAARAEAHMPGYRTTMQVELPEDFAASGWY